MAQVKFKYGADKTALDKQSLSEGVVWLTTDNGKLYIDAKNKSGTLTRHEVAGGVADKWRTARTITLGGDLSGNVTLDGTSNVTLTAAVLDDSHNHSNYLPMNGSDAMTGHLYLSGAKENSSTSNTTQIVFGTSNNNHVVISSNNNALVINPTTSTTTN